MLIACYTDILHNTKARYTQSIVFLVLKLRTLKICNINMNTKGKKKIFAFFVLTDHVRVYGHVERFKNFCAMSLCLLDCPIPSTFKRFWLAYHGAHFKYWRTHSSSSIVTFQRRDYSVNQIYHVMVFICYTYSIKIWHFDYFSILFFCFCFYFYLF